MFTKIASIGKSAWYWGALIALGIAMESVALYYQYGRDEMPCVMCIQVRLWVLSFTLVALLALYLRRFWSTCVLLHVLTTVAMAGLLERSWMLLGTERGTIVADCNFDLGLPAWFAVEKWLPAVFEVQTTCGYTPELLFGITMAEALIVLSAVLVTVSLLLTIASLLGRSAWRSN